MVVSPRTGSNAHIVYGWETTSGSPTFGTSPLINKGFGAKTAITSLTLTNNRLDLGKLGQVEPATFAYGTQTGSIGVSFVLCDTLTSTGYTGTQDTAGNGSTQRDSAGDIFRGIYGEGLAVAATTSPAFGAHTLYPSGGIGQGKAPKTIESLTIDVGFDASDDGTEGYDANVRTLKGCILNSLALSTSIGETINCTADFSYGYEDKPTKFYATNPPVTVVGTPYTFAHATLQVWNYTGTAALATVTLVQDFDLTFANNAELLYGLGSNQAVDQFRKSLDITGKFKIPVTDYKMLHNILAQIGKGGSDGAKSNATLDASTQYGGAIELKVTFANSNRNVIISLESVSITDLSWTGLEPTMPVYQDISFKAKSAKITVDITE